jgi:YMGG-like Gly-zipper
LPILKWLIERSQDREDLIRALEGRKPEACMSGSGRCSSSMARTNWYAKTRKESTSVMKWSAVALLLGWIVLPAEAQTSAPELAWSPAKSIGMFAYPKNKQTSDQQLKDESECYGSAKQNSGVDPQASAPASPTAEQQQAAQQQAAAQAKSDVGKGRTVKGAAGGAAGGAAVGAIAGDAGKGAAIGATVGAMSGRRHQRTAEAQAQQQRRKKLLRASSKLSRRRTLSTRRPWTPSSEPSLRAWMLVGIRFSNRKRSNSLGLSCGKSICSCQSVALRGHGSDKLIVLSNETRIIDCNRKGKRYENVTDRLRTMHFRNFGRVGSERARRAKPAE